MGNLLVGDQLVLALKFDSHLLILISHQMFNELLILIALPSLLILLTIICVVAVTSAATG